MKLTKTERFHMYNAAIDHLENNNKRSICTALTQIVLALKEENINIQDIEEHFPELNERLPLPHNADNVLRIEVLIECIKSINGNF